MSGIINSTGARSGVIGTTVGTPTSSGAWKLLQTVSGGGSTYDLTTDIGSTYDEYMIKGSDVLPVTSTAELRIRTKHGGSFQTGGSYSYANVNASTGGGDTQIEVNFNQTSGLQGAYFTMLFSYPTVTNEGPPIIWQETHLSSHPYFYVMGGGGVFRGNTDALEGVQYFYSSGNVLSGKVELYGLIK